MYEDVLDKEVEKKLDEYIAVFHDIFPLMQFDGSKKELIKEVNDCIKSKKKYDTSFYNDNEDILS